jgi:hypothetical protein
MVRRARHMGRGRATATAAMDRATAVFDRTAWALLCGAIALLLLLGMFLPWQQTCTGGHDCRVLGAWVYRHGKSFTATTALPWRAPWRMTGYDDTTVAMATWGAAFPMLTATGLAACLPLRPVSRVSVWVLLPAAATATAALVSTGFFYWTVARHASLHASGAGYTSTTHMGFFLAALGQAALLLVALTVAMRRAMGPTPPPAGGYAPVPATPAAALPAGVVVLPPVTGKKTA